MKFSTLAVGIAIGSGGFLFCLPSSSSAFVTPSASTRTTTTTTTTRNTSLLRHEAVAVGGTETSSSTPFKTIGQEESTGAMMDLSGIAFSGLKGKALSWRDEDYPKAIDLKNVIPKECFEPDTLTSLGYLSISLVSTALCTNVGLGLLSVFDPASAWTWPILWIPYSVVTGTVAMGLWVLAHECGHGAFSKNKPLQDAVGFILHSILLVPYYSWQRSHAVHHQYTNHMELGETHVPEPLLTTKEEEEEGGSYGLRAQVLMNAGKERGLPAWGILQGFLHLILGWPAYLTIGATGGPARGMTNHFLPDPIIPPPTDENKSKELFPGNWKMKVVQSDVGIATVVGGLLAWTACNGLPQVMALYGGPLIVINAWLVLYTWLQHTDVDVPHFSSDQHNFVKGALHTIDRPYDKLDPFGAIDFLHHHIGSTHVAHHFDSSIPHYKAQTATNALKEAYPQFYLYDPTPIPDALWRICKGCTAVEERLPGTWIWKNDGIESQLETEATTE